MRVCFQYSMYQIARCLMCVPSSCFINRVKKKNLRTCQSCSWCTVASRHDWTPHHIILHKCQERWGQGDPVHLNCIAQNIVLGFFPDSTQWPSTKIRTASHITAIPHCDLPSFFYLSNSCLSVSPSLSVVTRCVITALTRSVVMKLNFP